MSRTLSHGASRGRSLAWGTLLALAAPASGAVFNLETSVEGCNDVDASARAIVEQYLGPDVPDFSLYNTTRDHRIGAVDTLKTALFDYLGGDTVDGDFLQSVGIEYGTSLAGYVVPGVLCLIFLVLLGLPIIFVRCCCARKCCAPHHPLWGQEYGTLEDYPEPKCCGGSRKPLPKGVSEMTPVTDMSGKPQPSATHPVRPYTYCEQCSPVLVYIILAAFLLGVSISGTLAVGTIVSGLDGGVCSVDVLLLESRNFTHGLSDSVSAMLGVAVQVLDNIAIIVEDASGVSDIARNVSDAGGRAVGLIDNLLTKVGGSYSFDSGSITDSLTILDDAATILDSTLQDVLELLVDPRDTILSIVEMLDSITNMTDGFFDSADYVLHEQEVAVPEVPFISDGTPFNGALGATQILENVRRALFACVPFRCRPCAACACSCMYVYLCVAAQLQNAYTIGSIFFVLALVSIPFTTFGILVMGPKCAHKQHDKKSKTAYVLCCSPPRHIPACNPFDCVVFGCMFVSLARFSWQCCGLLFSRLSCLWLFMVLLIACIPALILFPTSIVVTDVCVIFEDFGANNDPYIEALLPMLTGGSSPSSAPAPSVAPSPSGAGDDLTNAFNFDIATGAEAVIDACFEDRSLLEALNITNTLYAYVYTVDFTDAVSLDLTSLVNISEIVGLMDDLLARTIYDIVAPVNSTDHVRDVFFVGQRVAFVRLPWSMRMQLVDLCVCVCVCVFVIRVQANLNTACGTCSNFGVAADALNKVPFYDYTISQSDRDSMDTCSDCSSGVFPSSADLPGSSGGFSSCAVWQAVFCQVDSNITTLDTELSAVQDEFTIVRTGILDMFASLQELKDSLDIVYGNVTDLANSVFTLNDFARCGFIGEFYNGMVEALCPGSASGLLWLAYSMNIMCITVLCIIVTIILINCRLGGVGQPRHHSDPKNLLPHNIVSTMSWYLCLQYTHVAIWLTREPVVAFVCSQSSSKEDGTAIPAPRLRLQVEASSFPRKKRRKLIMSSPSRRQQTATATLRALRCEYNSIQLAHSSLLSTVGSLLTSHRPI